MDVVFGELGRISLLMRSTKTPAHVYCTETTL